MSKKYIIELHGNNCPLIKFNHRIKKTYCGDSMASDEVGDDYCDGYLDKTPSWCPLKEMERPICCAEGSFPKFEKKICVPCAATGIYATGLCESCNGMGYKLIFD